VAPNAESSAVKFFSSKQRLAIAAVVGLLILFLLRPGISPLKTHIANAISRAVARPVEIGSVQLRFLPPGFDLENVIIHEDPAFGAEPMLRAPEVTAAVRLLSLLRGRLDIARLNLSEPSLNLVRRGDGRWNWEALLERTAQTPLAPTAKSKAEARPGFPYIEASSGRINFKAGAEKKAYALLNADFAIWQESENAWGVRLSAQPLRTDMNLSDTGLLRMNGIWQRAGSLRETPLQVSMEWDRAQLGQLSKLISGTDRGWRGEVRLDETMTGTPANLKVAANVAIDGFHRYDISSSEGLRLAAHCEGSYNSAEAVMHNIVCGAPVSDGEITLRGDAGLPGVHKFNLSLEVENIPVNSVTQLARRAKKDLPADLVSTGSIQGSFALNEDPSSSQGTQLAGRGEITNLRLQSAINKVEFAPGSIPFELSSGGVETKKMSGRFSGNSASAAANQFHVEYGPFSAPLGRPSPTQVRGWVGQSGYGMTIRGEGEVQHTLRLASLMGLPATKASVEGTAVMDLQIAGSWASGAGENPFGFSLPDVTGTVRLHNVVAAVRGVNSPIEIASAELKLLRDGVRVEKLNAQAAEARWTGSLALPRGCGTPAACVVHFNLDTDAVGLSGLREWLSPPSRERRWYQVLSSSAPVPPSFLQNLRAAGKVSAGRLLIHTVVAEKVTASVELERGKAQFSDLRGALLGGRHRGDWQIDFSGTSPVYRGSGTLSGIFLGQISDAMHDAWISGTAGGTYRVAASGADSTEFWQSADGELQFDVRDGVLPHVSLATDEGPLHLKRWQGLAGLHDGKVEIEGARLISPAEAYEVSGTASLGRELDLKLTRAPEMNVGATAQVYSITGTLAEPRVKLTPTPETRAQLKP
jgi:hypothetical protein